MRTLALAAVIATACSRQTAPAAMLVGGALTGYGVVDVAVEKRPPDAMVWWPAGASALVIGIPILVVGVASWLYLRGADDAAGAGSASR